VPDIKDSVGQGGTNNSHDVSLVQVMLRVIKDAKGVAYLNGNYDGAFGDITKAAITRFQQDQKLIPLPAAPAGAAAKVAAGPPAPAKLPAAATPGGVAAATEKTGLVAMNSLTLKKLNELLPASHKEILALEKTNLVYLPGSATDSKDLATTITGKIELDGVFRQKLANVVTQMYTDHKLTLAIHGTGWRRDFAKQLTLRLLGTGAHPGESNHQYGQASDLGMNGLEWVGGDGTIEKTDYWLNPFNGKGASMPQGKRDQLWKARNQIAYTTLGLHPTSKKGDDIHVQGYSDNAVDYPRSLAKLLNSVGKVKWDSIPVVHKYKTDFGLGGALFQVGTATDIWQTKAAVTDVDLLAAIKAAGKDLSKLPVFQDFQYVKDALKVAAKAPAANAPAAKAPPGQPPAVKAPGPPVIDGKNMKLGDIKAADIVLVQKLLKRDWEEADRSWKTWVAVP